MATTAKPGVRVRRDGNRVRLLIGSDTSRRAEMIAEFTPRGVHVQVVWVDPTERRAGLATELYEELGRLMREHRVDRFVRDDMIQPESREAVEKLRRRALEEARKPPSIETPFRFDGKNEAAQRAAGRQAAAMVTRIGEETRAALRALTQRAIREGIPVYDAARVIRSMVGMTDRQAMAAMNYRASLIDSGLSLARVDVLVDRYVTKKIRERAIGIARYEVMNALNQGQLEGWRQAREEGFLGRAAEKEAIGTADGRMCDDCAAVDGQRQPIDEPFQTPLGEFMMPPFHPGGCRCTAVAVA